MEFCRIYSISREPERQDLVEQQINSFLNDGFKVKHMACSSGGPSSGLSGPVVLSIIFEKEDSPTIMTEDKYNCVFPGSFDPFTKGHLDIVEKALHVFEYVHILIANNPEKDYMFTSEERTEIVKHSIMSLPKWKRDKVIVEYTDGTVLDYCHEHDIFFIVKGVRGIEDFQWEMAQAKYHHEQDDLIDTILIPTMREDVSSTKVRKSLKENNVGWKLWMCEYAVDYIMNFDKTKIHGRF